VSPGTPVPAGLQSAPSRAPAAPARVGSSRQRRRDVPTTEERDVPLPVPARWLGRRAPLAHHPGLSPRRCRGDHRGGRVRRHHPGRLHRGGRPGPGGHRVAPRPLPGHGRCLRPGAAARGRRRRRPRHRPRPDGRHGPARGRGRAGRGGRARRRAGRRARRRLGDGHRRHPGPGSVRPGRTPGAAPVTASPGWSRQAGPAADRAPGRARRPSPAALGPRRRAPARHARRAVARDPQPGSPGSPSTTTRTPGGRWSSG
jgi:hypothetical protein